METKYTKGEWKLTNNPAELIDKNLYQDKVYDEENNLLAKTYAENAVEAEANAKLIAAAPELLKQIKDMYDLVEMMGVKMLSEEWNESFRDIFNKVMNNAELLYSNQGININE